jgi:hypothetical protein
MKRYDGQKKPKVEAYLVSHMAHLKRKIAANTADTFWRHVALTLKQLDGMIDGYIASAEPNKKLTAADFYILNAEGDLFDIHHILGEAAGFRFKKMDVNDALNYVSLRGHCSAIIKHTGSDLLFGHATWSDFNEVFRIYKYYRFQYHDRDVRNRASSFSSYPGMIYSSDDFYVLDSGLFVTETTINVMDFELYKGLGPEVGVHAWIRNVVANRLSSTGKQWTEIYSHEASGTYNNQWMIVDLKLFEPNKPLKDNTLWLVEQIPHKVRAEDVTKHLRDDHYWASYNRPFFSDVGDASLFTKWANHSKLGDMFSYQNCPRAKIFKREQSKVSSASDLKALMGFNQYKTDPLSGGCPGDAIAARFDLDPLPGKDCPGVHVANGATDAKVSSFRMACGFESVARLGPTHDDVPAFRWDQTNGVYMAMKPAGVSLEYSGDWETMRPSGWERASWCNPNSQLNPMKVHSMPLKRADRPIKRNSKHAKNAAAAAAVQAKAKKAVKKTAKKAAPAKNLAPVATHAAAAHAAPSKKVLASLESRSAMLALAKALKAADARKRRANKARSVSRALRQAMNSRPIVPAARKEAKVFLKP